MLGAFPSSYEGKYELHAKGSKGLRLGKAGQS